MEPKSTDRGACILVADIGSACARDTWINIIYAVGTLIRYADVGGICIRCICARNVFTEGVKSRALARARIILASPGVNDCCFLLLIELIFALTKKMSCWGKW